MTFRKVLITHKSIHQVIELLILFNNNPLNSLLNISSLRDFTFRWINYLPISCPYGTIKIQNEKLSDVIPIL